MTDPPTVRLMAVPPRVLVIQRIVPHYRVPFFRGLWQRLARAGIALQVVHGQEYPGEAPVSAGPTALPAAWSRWRPNTYAAGAVWQSVGDSWRSADLVIVEQAERLLINHLLRVHRLGCPRPRIAFWGHGLDWRRPRGALINRVKRLGRGAVDHWFCYTQGVADELAEVPIGRKTVVDNSIDSRALAEAVRAAASRQPKHESRLLCIGSLRPDRRFDILLPTVDRLRARHTQLEIEFIGHGPEEARVRDFCAARQPWARWLGARFGPDAAPSLWQATALAMPGPVGLMVIDAFVGEAPMVTCAAAGTRLPEEGYLRHEDNAILTAEGIDAFAVGLDRVLSDAALRDRLRAGCRTAAARYTIENMVERFAAGIEAALGRD